MTREIKFRLRNGKQFYIIELSNNNCGCGWTQGNILAFQQFTGLLDKNGKEVYEGDILYFKRNDVVIKEHYMVVEYDEMKAGFYLTPIHMFPREKTSFRGEHIGGLPKEVIGNIYENPELLNTIK